MDFGFGGNWFAPFFIALCDWAGLFSREREHFGERRG